MRLRLVVPTLLFLSINLQSTDQVLDLPISVFEQDSVCEECLLGVLLQSHTPDV